MKNIFIIAGNAGSGKSTLCKKLSIYFNYPLQSFANMGKNLATKKGYNRIREYYQEANKEDFKEEITNHIINTIKEELENIETLIIDGLYVYNAVKILKEEYNCIVIHLKTKDEIRHERIAKRGNMTIEEAGKENKLKTEINNYLGMKELIEIADYIIDGNQKQEDVFEKTKKLIKETRK